MPWKALAVLLICLAAAEPASAADKPAEPVPSLSGLDPALVKSIDMLAAYVVRAVGKADVPVGIARFANLGDEARKLRIGETVSAFLQQRLAASKQVQLAEIEDIDRILEQIKLGKLGLVDSASAVEVGKLVGARIMVSGTVVPVGESYQIAIRLNDVATGRTLGATTVEMPRRLMIALTRDIYNLHQGWYEAPMRSLLVPGWGHFYNERPVRGSFYLTGAVALFAGAGYSAFAADARLADYRLAGRDEAAARYGDYQQAVRRTNLLLGLGALIWTVNVLDAGISGPAGEEWSVAFGPGLDDLSGEVRLAYRF